MEKRVKYYRLNWSLGGFVIIKRFGNARIFTKGRNGNKWTVFGTLIYGSTAGYTKSNRKFFFNAVDNIQELKEEDVLNEHFVWLI